MKYIFQVYYTCNPKVLAVCLESDSPFGVVHAGEFLNPSAWQDWRGVGDELLRVTSIQHAISSKPRARHVITAHVERVPDGIHKLNIQNPPEEEDEKGFQYPSEF